MAERLVLVDYGAGNLRSVENALRAAGATVDHIFVIFYYGIYPNSEKLLADLNIKLHHLCTWWDVLEYAKTCGQFDPWSRWRR